MHYSAKRGIVIARRASVCPSVMLVDQEHMGWKSCKHGQLAQHLRSSYLKGHPHG